MEALYTLLGVIKGMTSNLANLLEKLMILRVVDICLECLVHNNRSFEKSYMKEERWNGFWRGCVRMDFGKASANDGLAS